MASSSTAKLGSQVKAFHTCQAVCDLVQHGEASSMPTLLKSWPLQYLQRFLHTRCVVVPAKGEASSSVCNHFNLGDALVGSGSQTLEAYSRIGLISVLHALSLTFRGSISRFHLRNPTILFALAHMLLMHLSHPRFLWMVRPWYLEEETVSSVCP